MIGRYMFPDVRAEWNPWARRHLRKLLQTISPQVVISSHEPASTIALGRFAHGLGYRWIVDMGDPVLSSYTPVRWRRRAHAVESMVMREANGILVTSERTRDLLVARHGVGKARCHVVTQGFDDGVIVGDDMSPGIAFDEQRLELLYTGRLYGFRRIDPLLEALQAQPAARLTVITPYAPPSLVEAATRFPERIRVFGPVPHRSILKLQRRCDVLVNIANDDPVHVPGKFYEYLGARKPIIHLRAAESDAVADLFEASGQGAYAPVGAEALSVLLTNLDEQKRNKTALVSFALSLDREAYTWRALAARVAAICAEAGVSSGFEDIG
jgi:glycosyltransferase involved in cell wall biosynthesis